MKKSDYEDAIEPMQEALVAMARWPRVTGQRIVVIFEGRDTAGKGGAIRAVSEKLNPRQCHVIALGKPTEDEQGQWYFQRYVEYLPTRGEITLFDRSWYNRAGVERVMGFCNNAEYTEFMRQAPEFERNLVRSGTHLIKFWFSVSAHEQRRRFKEREVHPLKPLSARVSDPWCENEHRVSDQAIATPNV